MSIDLSSKSNETRASLKLGQPNPDFFRCAAQSHRPASCYPKTSFPVFLASEHPKLLAYNDRRIGARDTIDAGKERGRVVGHAIHASRGKRCAPSGTQADHCNSVYGPALLEEHGEIFFGLQAGVHFDLFC